MGLQHIIKEELEQTAQVLHDFTHHRSSLPLIEVAAQQMAMAIKANKKIISCGNGGSHCDAMHFAEELTGRYRKDRKALPAICISDPAHISCVSNDYGYKFVFSRYLEALAGEGDVLLAISTSGNSPSVVQAVKVAKEKKMYVIALSGSDGGRLATLADTVLCVPHKGSADRVQEMHIKIIHILILLIEKLVI